MNLTFRQLCISAETRWRVLTILSLCGAPLPKEPEDVIPTKYVFAILLFNGLCQYQALSAAQWLVALPYLLPDLLPYFEQLAVDQNKTKKIIISIIDRRYIFCNISDKIIDIESWQVVDTPPLTVECISYNVNIMVYNMYLKIIESTTQDK